MGTRVNPDTCRIRVDGEIRFENGYVKTWKFLNRKEKVADSNSTDIRMRTFERRKKHS